MHIKAIATIALFSWLAATAALAQVADFAHFDRNKDGRVVAHEVSYKGENEIIAAMDANKDGSVTPDEWLKKGRGASFVDEGGVDQDGVTRRWLRFRIVFFEFTDGVISTSVQEGQAPLAVDATPQKVAEMREWLNNRFATVDGELPRMASAPTR